MMNPHTATDRSVPVKFVRSMANPVTTASMESIPKWAWAPTEAPGTAPGPMGESRYTWDIPQSIWMVNAT